MRHLGSTAELERRAHGKLKDELFKETIVLRYYLSKLLERDEGNKENPPLVADHAMFCFIPSPQ